MARKEFKLPDVGEGVAEGELVSWLVEAGDEVREDQPVAEVETDKALVELPSPYDGTVAELRAEVGEVVPVGEVMLVFEVDDGDADDGDVEVRRADEGEAAESAADGADVGADGTEPKLGASDGTVGESTATSEGEPQTGGRVFATPSVRRLARELGVDLSSVDGSGPSGRVTEADVREAAEGASDGTAEAEAEGEASDAGPGAPAAGSEPGATGKAGDGESVGSTAGAEAGEPAGRERTLAAPATRRVAREEGVDIDDVPAVEEREGEAFVTEEAVREYAAAQRAARAAETEAETEAGAAVTTRAGAERGAVDGAESEPGAAASAEASDADTGSTAGERVPYRGVRRAIGEQMERSKYTAPHISHHDWVDATELVALREEYRGLAAERGVRLTYVPFVVKAVVAALREFPYLNSTLDEEAEEIRLHGEYNVGIATATEAGLMVPVIEDAAAKSLLQLAREVSDKAERARNRSIARGEMQGGTFTVTNVGGIGGEYATPIINYPEVAILALGAIDKRPVVVEDGDAGGPKVADDGTVGGEVVPRYTLPLSLSVDHRVVDGAMAAEFTNRLKELLANPKVLLIE